MRKIFTTAQEKQNEKNEIINISENQIISEYQNYGKFLIGSPVIETKSNYDGFTEDEIISWYGEIPPYWEYSQKCGTGFEKGKFGLYRHEGFTNKGAAFYHITELPKIVGVKIKEGKTMIEFIELI